MQLGVPLVMLAVHGAAVAQDIDFTNWAAPGPGDLRGPCPGLNSLANHHLIPHNGRNLTVPFLVDVLGKVFNLSPEFAAAVSAAGLAARGPDATFFDLPDLNNHDVTEHDASLSRADLYFAGPDGVATFDRATFDRFFSHFQGMEFITTEAAAAARYGQVRYSRAHNPEFKYDAQQRVTGYAETVLYMSTMIDNTGKTKTDFVRILFEEERLPYKQGWRPPKTQINGVVLAQAVLEEALATPEKTLWCGWGPRPANQTTFDIPGCFGVCESIWQMSAPLCLTLLAVVLVWGGKVVL